MHSPFNTIVKKNTATCTIFTYHDRHSISGGIVVKPVSHVKNERKFLKRRLCIIFQFTLKLWFLNNPTPNFKNFYRAIWEIIFLCEKFS